MQNSTRYAKDQKPRLNPSEHKELVKISGDRILEIQESFFLFEQQFSFLIASSVSLFVGILGS